VRVLMIAPPGAGKGTQGALIAAHFDIPHIATGELLRHHVARDTELGRAVRRHLDRGELVPDQIVLDMVTEAMIAAKAAGGGYVLDGIPRNLSQARQLYQIGRELEESAQMSGAGWWHTFRRIILPLLAPGLIAGWIYIVVVSFRELGASVLLYSPGKEVLSIVIWEQWRDGLQTQVAALGGE